MYLTTVRLTGRVYSKLQDYLLAVVVSLKNYAAPLLYMSDKKVNAAVLVYLTSVVVQIASIIHFPYSGRRTQKGREGRNYLFSRFGERK